MEVIQSLKERVAVAVRDFASAINSGSKIVADISALVDVTSQLPLSNLDYWERFIRQEFFYVLKPACRSQWETCFKFSRPLSWLDIISSSGYEREKTLCALTGAVPNSFFFALTVRRLNDWVPEVRQAARQQLPVLARLSDPAHVTEALYATLPHWNSWGRMEDSDKQTLLDIISAREITDRLIVKILSATSGPVASVFVQIGRTAVIDTYLDEIARKAIQPSVRAKAYRSQLENKFTWFEGRKWEWTNIQYCEGRLKTIFAERNLTVTRPLPETLKMAAVDVSPMVRRIAAEILIRDLDSLGDEALAMATLFAADPSPSVSERGHFALKELGGC